MPPIRHDFSSVAFLNISTGVYGFPRREAARIALEAVKTFDQMHPNDMEVLFACFDEENFGIYRQLINR